MAVAEVLASVRYVTDAKGKKTDVLVPVAVWEALLTSWQELIEQIEDREDAAILQDWLKKRAAGVVETISLDALEQELIEDGLVSS